MSKHGSRATTREATPHANQTTKTATSQTLEPNENEPGREKIEALTEMICSAGDQSATALLVLMATLQNAAHPKALAHHAKHLAFTRCGELNAHGMVDTQIAMLESELLTNNTHVT